MITARFRRNLPKVEKIGAVNVYRLGVGVPVLDKLFLPFWGAWFALRLNQKNHYDYFWCLMATFASGAAYIANIIHFWLPVPIILTLQEGDSEEHFKKRWLGLINLSWRLALRKTKILTVISSYLAERAKKFGYQGEIQIIPNGVDLKMFNDGGLTLKTGELTKKFKISEDDKLVITVSRLVKKNAVGDVVKSLKYLPPNVKFLILGVGQEESDLKLLAGEMGLEKRVFFLGHIGHEALPGYLRLADIFVRPSLSEGLGNSFLEAMAAGLPVIGTKVGGIRDFLVDGETGLFCEVRNSENIAEKIKIYLEHKELREKIKARARELVVKKYDWNLIALKMKNIFEKITI